MPSRARKVDRQRWLRKVVDVLEDFPRQYAALDSAMAAFGGDFDLAPFKQAYETRTDMDAYNRVQAVERAVGRVQNYVGDLALNGARLAGLDLSGADHGGEAKRAFRALRDAKVIDGGLCSRLIQAQDARIRIEHSYVKLPAGDVHRATVLVSESARDFIGDYREWIEEFL